MNDEMFDRQYQQGRAQLNADLGRAADRLAKTISDSLAALHRLEWTAPWARSTRPAHRR